VWEFELVRRAFQLVPGHRRLHTATTGFSMKHEVHAVAWSPDGRYLLAGGEPIPRVFARSGEMQRLFQAAHQTPVRLVAWSPEGQLVTSAGYDNIILIWEAASGALLFPYRVPYTEVTHLAWSPSGDLLAAAYADGPVQIWDPRTLQTAVRYTGHTSRVQALAWSPNGQMVLSGDREGHVHAWEARTGRLALQYVAQPMPALQVLALAWSPDGKYVAAGAEKTMQIVRLPRRLVELVRP
jgi:WD40 repeat protein